MKIALILFLLPIVATSQTKTTKVLPTDIYHEYPVNGVPLINGKNTTIKMTCTGFEVPRIERIQIRFNSTPEENKNQPLLIVNGCETDFSAMKYITPYAIESIDVLKDAKAFERFGDKAKHGAIIIELRTSKSTETVKPVILKPVPAP